jgi:hypothetical protein
MFVCPVLGQQTQETAVFGKVFDYLSGEPLSFANVILFDANVPDSVQIAEASNKGVFTDNEGTFRINDLANGEFFVRVSFMGYETKKSRKFSIASQGQQVDLKIIQLDQATNFIDGVVVEAEKSTYNLGIDRKVYNVEKDILAETGSATEILNNIPSVSVDVNGAVTLRGTSGARADGLTVG